MKKKRIGLVDVDGSDFPNVALMKIARYHKNNGDNIEWRGIGDYDLIYASKIFTFSPDLSPHLGTVGETIKGGTGYDAMINLPDEIDKIRDLDYSIYPKSTVSIQFFSRGCIRNCKFCIVRKKEGYIHPVTPMNLNPRGKKIEILDNNFFANPEWREAVSLIKKWNQPVTFHGIDVRILDEEQAKILETIKLSGNYMHIAWDYPDKLSLEKMKMMVKYVKPPKIVCYILIGFNTTPEQDLYRVREIVKLGIRPFVQTYRDFKNEKKQTQYEKDFQSWGNFKQAVTTVDFMDFVTSRGLKCSYYFSDEYKELQKKNIVKYAKRLM